MKLLLVRVGNCRRCGRCCDKSLAQPDIWEKMMRSNKPDVRIYEGKAFSRVCPSLERQEDGTTRCRCYKTRPPICREFPRKPDDLKMIPECGFKFVWRKDDEP